MVWVSMEFTRWGKTLDRIAKMDVIQCIISNAQVRAISEARTHQFHLEVGMFDDSVEKRKARQPTAKPSSVVLAPAQHELQAATVLSSDDASVVSEVNKPLQTDTRKVEARIENESTHTSPRSFSRQQCGVEGPPRVRPAETLVKRDRPGTRRVSSDLDLCAPDDNVGFDDYEDTSAPSIRFVLQQSDKEADRSRSTYRSTSKRNKRQPTEDRHRRKDRHRVHGDHTSRRAGERHRSTLERRNRSPPAKR